MSEVRNTRAEFADELSLWPEEWTDCYRLNLNHPSGETLTVLTDLLADTGYEQDLDFAWMPETRTICTSTQTLVDELKERLYGAEIAFAHTHIPEPAHG